MTSANVELVRSIYAKWERGEYGSVEWAGSEIEYVFADRKASGLHLQVKGACLFHVRDAKVTRLVVYRDRDRVFADLGLSSEGWPLRFESSEAPGKGPNKRGILASSMSGARRRSSRPACASRQAVVSSRSARSQFSSS